MTVKKHTTYGLNCHRSDDATLIADLEAFKEAGGYASMSDVLREAVAILLYGHKPAAQSAPDPIAPILERIALAMEMQAQTSKGIERAIAGIKINVVGTLPEGDASEGQTEENIEENIEEIEPAEDMEDPNDPLVQNLMGMKFDY